MFFKNACPLQSAYRIYIDSPLTDFIPIDSNRILISSSRMSRNRYGYFYILYITPSYIPCPATLLLNLSPNFINLSGLLLPPPPPSLTTPLLLLLISFPLNALSPSHSSPNGAMSGNAIG